MEEISILFTQNLNVATQLSFLNNKGHSPKEKDFSWKISLFTRVNFTLDWETIKLQERGYVELATKLKEIIREKNLGKGF